MFVTRINYGQSFTRSIASASAEIITPVGAEKNGEIVINNFRLENATSTIELKQNMLLINGKMVTSDLNQKINIPSFYILNGKSSYSITINYDPVLVNNYNTKESILIEDLIVLPLDEKRISEKKSEGFSLGAKLKLGVTQAPGNYTSKTPYRIAIHFN